MSNRLREFARSSLAAGAFPREIMIAALCVALGTLVMPCLIFAVGRLALGAYAHGNLFAFWHDFVQGLLGGSEARWFIVLGPYLLLWLLRGGRRLLHNRPAG